MTKIVRVPFDDILFDPEAVGEMLTGCQQRHRKMKLVGACASDEVLIKRYKETRRAHPLSGEGRIEEGIESERQILQGIRESADFVVDTSQLLTRELRRTLEAHEGALILMDECGHLEKNALLFQREILSCLNGQTPVLGVLRKDQPWHDFIKSHPRVRIITITGRASDDLPAQIAKELTGSI